jgi:hypothetical protein
LSTGAGECRDVVSEAHKQSCEADSSSLAFLQTILDDEKPDLVVFTGDQVNGDSSPNARSVSCLTTLLISRLFSSLRSCVLIGKSPLLRYLVITMTKAI